MERSRENQPPQGLLRRLGWFVLLWLAGVAAVASVAYGIRLWLGQ